MFVKINTVGRIANMIMEGNIEEYINHYPLDDLMIMTYFREAFVEYGPGAEELVIIKDGNVSSIDLELVVMTYQQAELPSELQAKILKKIVELRVRKEELENFNYRKVPLDEYVKVKQHGMSANYLYTPRDMSMLDAEKIHKALEMNDVDLRRYLREVADENIRRQKRVEDRSETFYTLLVNSEPHEKWMKNWQRKKKPGIEYWESKGVDFSKDIHVRLAYVHVEGFDVANFSKATIDAYINHIRGTIKKDDNVVLKVTTESIGFCKELKDGETYIHIENIK